MGPKTFPVIPTAAIAHPLSGTRATPRYRMPYKTQDHAEAGKDLWIFSSWQSAQSGTATGGSITA